MFGRLTYLILHLKCYTVYYVMYIINPRHACAKRVTVLVNKFLFMYGLLLCMKLLYFVILTNQYWYYCQKLVKDKR